VYNSRSFCVFMVLLRAHERENNEQA